MEQLFFSIGKFMEATFDWLLVPFQGVANGIIVLVMAIGAVYWLMVQNRMNRRAREKGTYI